MDLLGVTVLVGVLVLATVAGLLLRGRDGRIRRSTAPRPAGGWALAGLAPTDVEHVLLLQLSSPICTPCRRTAELLDGWTAGRSDIAHREIDVARQPRRRPHPGGAAYAHRGGLRPGGGRAAARLRGAARRRPGSCAGTPMRADVVRWAGARSRKTGSSATLGSVFWPLTRRRAVDLCRVGSCLCHAS